MNEKEFDELIDRCLNGRASEEEKILVERWLDRRNREDPFNKLSDDEKQEVRERMFLRLSLRMREQKSLSGITRRSGVHRRFFFRAAAAVLLIAALSYSLLKHVPDAEVEKISMIRAASSGVATKKVILGDSTIVWLKGNSSIVYPEKFLGNERNVTLTGEALFEVSKDPDHPFIIECGGLMARVLGTSFNIRAMSAHIEVLVLTGKVELSSRSSKKGFIVLPNEKAVYNENNDHLAKVLVSGNEISRNTRNTEYDMRFHATRMTEIIERIEAKFSVSVQMTDELLGNCTITADLTDQSLDRTLSMISQTLKIKYEITNGQVLLKGRGCSSLP